MTREEFLIEVTLRLVSTRVDCSPATIIDMAEELTNSVFSSDTSSCNKDINNQPIQKVIQNVDKHTPPCSGFVKRITKVFKENNINTVGDLLKVGQYNFMNFKFVGRGMVNQISIALDELYGIDW